VAIDRAATLRNAEKLLRTGKLEPAIAEYLRVVEAQPQDWNTANILGDLYVRAGQSDKAVAQFARIADSLGRDGFFPKAAALYKKIIKIRPEDEHALLQAGEMAANQGVLVDARTYLNTVADLRVARGDAQGAAEIRIRLGSLDPSDFDARRTGARARVETGDSAGAMTDLKTIAADLVDRGRQADAIAVLREAAEIDPSDEDVRGQLFTAQLADGDLDRAHEWATTPQHFHALGLAYLGRGDMASAARFLTAESAAGDPDLLLKIAAAKLLTGALDEGLAIVRQVLKQDRVQSGAITLLGCEIAKSAPDAGFAVVEIAAESSVAEGDWPSAASALEEFVTRVPHHIPALMRMVEIYFDGRLESGMYAAQAQLAEAYLATGAPAEARVIAEDLMDREPSEPSHVEQFRRALVALGEEDPDRVIAERISAAPEYASAEEDLFPALEEEPAPPDPVADEAAAAPADSVITGADEPAADSVTDGAEERAPVASVNRGPRKRKAAEPSEAIEIDLNDVLSDFTTADAPPAEPEEPAGPRKKLDLDQVFKQFRKDASHGSKHDAARAAYDRAVALRDAGLFDESIPAFEAASREPRLRFHAAAALGRLYRHREAFEPAIEWFEQASQAPAPTPDEAYELFLELAEALESFGQVDRALATCRELQAEAGDYRDVAARISRLTKAQARG
jgi:tetratricopeptide (TPR) repeat protein